MPKDKELGNNANILWKSKLRLKRLWMNNIKQIVMETATKYDTKAIKVVLTLKYYLFTG
jgi:hypothetical protein